MQNMVNVKKMTLAGFSQRGSHMMEQKYNIDLRMDSNDSQTLANAQTHRIIVDNH